MAHCRSFKNSVQKVILVTLNLIVFFYISINLYSQNEYHKFIYTHDDSTALENVFVEKYFVSDLHSRKDSSIYKLPKGSITYRIYIDMKPGYKLQMVYGDAQHLLKIATSTRFYNNDFANAYTGFNIDTRMIDDNNVAFDSWITMGAASRGFTGIPLSEDTSDGFSLFEKYEQFKNVDGFTKAVLPDFRVFNLDLGFFKDTLGAQCFSTSDGAWAAMGGIAGPTKENSVLICQLTTEGDLTFEFNVQIGTPTGKWIKFVSKDPRDQEIQFKGLLR